MSDEKENAVRPCDCSGDDEYCEHCNPGLAPRVFCRNCGRAIFHTGDEWVHVSTHCLTCPPTFAQPTEVTADAS